MLQRFPNLATIGLYLAALVPILAIGSLQRRYIVDDGLIYARFAEHIFGVGSWSFNAQEGPVYATTSPLWTMLLVILRYLGITPTAGLLLLTGFSLMATAVGVGEMLKSKPLWLRAVAMCTVTLVPTVWQSQGLDVILAVGLCAWTVIAFAAKKEVVAGALLGAAVLARPDSVVVAPLLFVIVFWEEKRIPWKGGGTAFLIVLPWLVFAQMHFGTILPATLEVKTSQRAIGWWASGEPFWSAAISEVVDVSWGIFFGIGCALATFIWRVGKCSETQRQQGDKAAMLFGGYGALHWIAYSLLDVPSAYFWYFVPFVLASVVLGFVGVGSLYLWACRYEKKWVVALPIVVSLAVLGSAMRETLKIEPEYRLAASYRAVGEVLRQSVKPGERVAASEIGYIGYFSGAEVLDMHGLIHPESRQRIREGNSLWWIGGRPEWIVVHRSPWFGEPGYKGQAADYGDDEYLMFATVTDSTLNGTIDIYRRRIN